MSLVFDFWNLLRIYRTAGHLVFWKPWPVTGHVATVNIKRFKLRLRARGYPNNLIDETLSEVKFSDRKTALRKYKSAKRYITLFNAIQPICG